jgi:glycosyltransferase involved in cell wall biosynthesis
MEEKVGILLATYNGAHYIEEQLESILLQTYKNWVCYIHDDGSTDDTMSIIKEYKRKYPESFIVLDYVGCGGACKNFLSLMKYPEEKYIMFSDQDDVWKETKIEDTLKKMIETEIDPQKPCAVFTDLYVVDDKLNVISESFMRYSKHRPDKLSVRDLFVGNPAPGCTMMINQTLLKMAVLYNCPERIEMHDWWCMLIAATFGQIAYLNKPTIFYRQHGKNALGAIDRNSFSYCFSVLISIVLGKRYKETQDRIIAKRKMAKEMADCFGDLLTDNGFVKQLSEIDKKSKVNRIKFYWENHLYNTTQHGFWIMLSC